MTHDRGITIHFTDGTSLGFEFPKQTDNKYAGQIMTREILAERLLMVESDGALYFVPFDNIRYISAFPAAGDVPKNTIRGATVREWSNKLVERLHSAFMRLPNWDQKSQTPRARTEPVAEPVK